MLPGDQQNNATSGCRLVPQARMPTPAVLRTLPADDVKLLRTLLSERVEYMPNPLFDRADAEALLLRPLHPPRGGNGRDNPNDDSGIYGLGAADGAPPIADREQFLFLRLNFCRRRVFELLQAHAGARLSAGAVAELLRWERAALETRGEIVRENVPLVLAMAKRTRIPGVDLTDLISEGNLALLRAVLKFDCARGYKFSTYACRSILKSFSRVASRAARHRGYFPTEFDPELEKGDYLEQRRVTLEGDCISELKAIMEQNAAGLTDVERAVIQARFALDEDADDLAGKAKTLEEVGALIGVTKERVRQIQNKALGKLRAALETGILAR